MLLAICLSLLLPVFLFRLISPLSGLLYGFFFVSVFVFWFRLSLFPSLNCLFISGFISIPSPSVSCSPPLIRRPFNAARGSGEPSGCPGWSPGRKRILQHFCTQETASHDTVLYYASLSPLSWYNLGERRTPLNYIYMYIHHWLYVCVLPLFWGAKIYVCVQATLTDSDNWQLSLLNTHLQLESWIAEYIQWHISSEICKTCKNVRTAKKN